MSEESNPRHLVPQPSGDPQQDATQQAKPTIPARVADEAYLKALKSRAAERDRQDRPRRVGYGVLIALAVVVVLFVGSALNVYLDARSIVGSAKAIPSAMLSGDSDTINASVDHIKGRTANMNFVVNTPIWNLGCVLPGLGQDFRNIQELSGLLNDVRDGVLDPLASDSGQIAGNDVMSEDTINVSALLKVAQIVENLTPALQGIGERANTMERGVIPQVNDAVAMVKTYAGQLNTFSGTLSKLTDVLPGLLGADGRARNYLLIAQNSAELRPTGGIPGAWGVVTVDNGKISIGDLGHPDNVSRDSTPAITLTQDDLNIMGDYYAYMKPDIFWVSSNFDPDFSHSAQHFETYWKLLVEQGITGSSQQDLPTDIDGVVAVNPIFVQRLLSLTDGYDVDGTHVDGSNAAKIMLHDAYWNLAPEDQDGYFGQVAAGAMSTIMGGLTSMDTSGLLSVLQDAFDRGDMVMYFNDDDLESVVEDFNADGKVSDDEANPVLGTYFYDITWSKMDWYLNSTTTIGNATQNDDGSTTYEVTTTLINEMTDDEAQNAPDYVVGYGDNPLVAHRGGMATVVYLYAPAGGSISDLECNSGQFSKTEAEGHELYHGHVILDPQRRETITYKVTTSTEATSQLVVDSTPTLLDVAGWQNDDKPDSDFQLQDGSSYGSVEADDSSTIDNLLSNSASSGRTSSSQRSSSSTATSSSSSTSSTSSTSSSDSTYSSSRGSNSYEYGENYDNGYADSSDSNSTTYDDNSGDNGYSDYSGDTGGSGSDGYSDSGDSGGSDSSGGDAGYSTYSYSESAYSNSGYGQTYETADTGV